MSQVILILKTDTPAIVWLILMNKKRELICTLYWVLVIALSSDGEHHCCCLLSSNFHGCPEIYLYDQVNEVDFGEVVDAETLFKNGIYVRIPVKSSLKSDAIYTVVGFTTDRSIPGRARGVIGWMIFLAINVTGQDLLKSDVYKLNSIVPFELGSCEDLYDVEVELRVVLFQQSQPVRPRIFDINLDVIRRYDMSSATNLVEFETFRHQNYYVGPPQLVKMYTLRKCPKAFKLSYFLQALEYRGEARALQSYHFESSPTYHLHESLMKSVHTRATVYKHMVEYELTECSLHADLYLMEGPTPLSHIKNPCPRFNIGKYLAKIITAGREGVYIRHLRTKFGEYFIDLAQYSKTMQRLIRASDKYMPRTHHSKSEELEVADCQGVHPAFVRLCWVSLFRKRRLAIKMDIIGRVLANLTTKWPEVPVITDVED
ncbi:unnamed protein product [Calicophoron daubneyi]|uniref:Uncharacterized protein n=1 Tax=Calicophoron daubneyi TaxID=300641 RepID=A0AAV2TYP9_CALDB